VQSRFAAGWQVILTPKSEKERLRPTKSFMIDWKKCADRLLVFTVEMIEVPIFFGRSTIEDVSKVDQGGWGH
jgi:hypothetical protein